MAAPLLFYDLGLIASSSSGDGRDGNSSSSRLQLLATTARALELGYAGVALDHHHRGLLADSHVCRTDTFAPLSSLPLPSSAALHRRRLASPASEAFRQYTRITLSLDSAAATASALAPSAARLLRTYDLVAARPLTQAAFDHLCQTPLSAQHLDLISIDFSSHGKMPFRIKPPMLKLALQKGLHFEIAYSPLLSTDVNDKRNLIAQVKVSVILLLPNDPAIHCFPFVLFCFANRLDMVHTTLIYSIFSYWWTGPKEKISSSQALLILLPRSEGPMMSSTYLLTYLAFPLTEQKLLCPRAAGQLFIASEIMHGSLHHA
jgi:hypothetical protein